jgi:HNH endonuclease/NUMOD4 motif
MTEEWRPVVGREKEYEVSDLGRVRSLERTIVYVREGKERTRRGAQRILVPMIYAGYPAVQLGRRNSRYIHHLILEAFVGPRPAGMECRHLDGNELHCNRSNLAWGTVRENAQDRARHGTQPRGERVYGAKLTPCSISEIKSQLGIRSHREIGEMYGVGREAITKIANGRNWRHL